MKKVIIKKIKETILFCDWCGKEITKKQLPMPFVFINDSDKPDIHTRCEEYATLYALKNAPKNSKERNVK